MQVHLQRLKSSAMESQATLADVGEVFTNFTLLHTLDEGFVFEFLQSMGIDTRTLAACRGHDPKAPHQLLAHAISMALL